jgi:hypothetical protein
VGDLHRPGGRRDRRRQRLEHGLERREAEGRSKDPQEERGGLRPRDRLHRLQREDLLAEAQVESLEYNERPVLKDGKIVSFLGFTFVPTERLPVDGSGFRRLPVWVKSGMHFGKWGSPRVDIREDTTLKGYPWRVYSFETCNATRRDPKKVVEIKIAE